MSPFHAEIPNHIEERERDQIGRSLITLTTDVTEDYFPIKPVLLLQDVI